MNARYTVYLKDLLENPVINEQIHKALSTYPLYVAKDRSTEYIPNIIPTRDELNKKLLNHFKYREIGFETVGRFIDELEIAMCEIMPEYNLWYASTDYDYNMIFNVDYERKTKRTRADENSGSVIATDNTTTETESTEQSNATGTDNSTTNSETTGDVRHIESLTPQSQLNAKKIDNVTYADKMTWDENTNADNVTKTGNTSTTANGTATGKNTTQGTNEADSKGTHTEDEDITEIIKGNYGQVSYQRLIAQFREIIVNIDKKIFNDKRIQELFMIVY